MLWGDSEYKWHLRICFVQGEGAGLSHCCTSGHWLGVPWGGGGVRQELLGTHGSKYIQVKWLQVNPLKKVTDWAVGSKAAPRSSRMVHRTGTGDSGESGWSSHSMSSKSKREEDTLGELPTRVQEVKEWISRGADLPLPASETPLVTALPSDLCD